MRHRATCKKCGRAFLFFMVTFPGPLRNILSPSLLLAIFGIAVYIHLIKS